GLVQSALDKGDESAIESSAVADYVRQYYQVDGRRKMLLIPMCMYKDKQPYHWVLPVLHEGIWKVCNSMNQNPAQSRQIHSLTRPLSKVLNEMGHKDKDGAPISPNLKIPLVLQQQQYPDRAIFICWYMKTLVKFENTEMLQGGRTNVYVEKFNKKRVKMAFRILNATDEWKHQKGTYFGPVVIYSQ
ncbi:hypothetical protein MKW98_013150, partial [Papaver atlanticum]